jgi:pimeloyl-ACP methyl ester carboxylesterase
MQPYISEAPRSSPLTRVLKGLVLVAVIAVLLWHLAEGWSISTWIGEEYLTSSPAVSVDDAAVIGLDSDRITLRRADGADTDVATPGVLGFAGDGFYLRLGEIVGSGTEDVTRTFETVEGALPPIGAFGDIDPAAQAPGALDAAGLHDTTYPGPLGTMDALAIDAGSTWVIHVHDRLGTVRQALPVMLALSETGATQLSIAYRNEPGEPADEDGRFTFGVDERLDLEAAIAFARDSGAEQIILVGYGTGGSVVMAQVFRDSEIAGAILDSPTLDAAATVREAAQTSRDGVLGMSSASAAWVGNVFASLRYGVDWETSDYLSRATQLAVPTLVIHGTEDEQHPIASSRELAAQVPDRVRLVEIDGAPGGLAWNADPGTYESAVLEFVDALRNR